MTTIARDDRFSERRTFLEPVASSPRADDEDAPRPARVALAHVLASYVSLTVVLIGIGMLLTHALTGSVGRWDDHVNRTLVAHRSGLWNDLTQAATWMINTFQVIAAAAVVTTFLAFRHRWREAAFLVIALVLEITVFLSVTFVVARPRPAVPRLNSTPTTGSFPSGHTAAATVLFAGVALIISCCTTNRFARVASGTIAVLVAALVGFARVYRGLHHPTDVMIGALFGVACLVASAMTVRATSAAVQHHVASDGRQRRRARPSVPTTRPQQRVAG